MSPNDKSETKCAKCQHVHRAGSGPCGDDSGLCQCPAIIYACQFCRVLEPEEHKPDCFVFTVTALRAEVEERKRQLDALIQMRSDDIARWRAANARLTAALRDIAENPCCDSGMMLCCDRHVQVAREALANG